MRLKLISSVCLLCVVVFASSCYKPDKPTSTTPTPTSYTFTNLQGLSVHIDLYNNRAAYTAGTGAFKSFDVASKATMTVALSELSDTTFIDWYSSDYTMTNWLFGQYDYQFSVPYFVKNIKNTLSWDNHYPGPATLLRGTCLNGGTSTNWSAVGGFIDSAKGAVVPGGFTIKYWSDDSTKFPNNWKYRKITLRRDFTATYTFKDRFGNLQTRDYNYRHGYTNNTNIGYLFFYNKSNNAMVKDSFYNVPMNDTTKANSSYIRCRIDSVGVFYMQRQ